MAAGRAALANRLVEWPRGMHLHPPARTRPRLLAAARHPVIEIDPEDQESLNEALAGCAGAVNLAGILNERGDDGAGFRRVHVDRAAHAKVQARRRHPSRPRERAQRRPVRRQPHQQQGRGKSSLPSTASARWCRSQTFGDLGPEDDFTNRFARLLRLAPGLFPLARAEALSSRSTSVTWSPPHSPPRCAAVVSATTSVDPKS